MRPLRHYTDDVGRAAIESFGSILPGSDGRVYLTRDEYDNVRDAIDKLALPRPPTGYFEIPTDRLVGLSVPSQVAARHGRPGGGTEQHVSHPVDASYLTWVSVEP